jgi:hypothetical protein
MQRLCWAVPFLALLLVGPAPGGAKEVDALVAKIKAAGREGAGNVEAAAAWKALVGKGVDALIPTLRAMSDEDLTSANWLRPAVNAIVEKAGRSLPKADLEKFIGDTRHAAIARRLAYELVVSVDASAPARLLPKMLLDPSPELRRDAVQRAIEEGEALVGNGDKPGAKAVFQRAFKGAADKDQVDALAKHLKGLGVQVDLARHLGVVRCWHLVTPFDHTGESAFHKAYPPEKKVDLQTVYKGKGGQKARWVEHVTADPYGMVDLNKVLGKHKGTIAYAFAAIESPSRQQAQVRAGCINALKVFLNGKEVFAREEYHHGMGLDQYSARVTLQKGRNELLLKVCQNEQTDAWAQNWQFQVRLCDFTGSAVPFSQPAAKKEDKP